MRAITARRLQRVRVATQVLGLVGFVALLLAAGHPRLPYTVARGVFFLLDPLLLLVNLAAAHAVPLVALLALVPVVSALLLGRSFCGWACPFGALQRFSASMLGGFRRRHRPEPRWLRVKYLVLIALLVAALAGLNLAGWLDPFALLTRSLAAAVNPAIEAPLRGLTGAAAPVAAQPILLGALFVIVLALNAWRRRFFCNVICPLGALLGLLARFGLLRLEAANGCASCRSCARRCTYDGDPGDGYRKSECTVCLHCAADCPREGVTVHFGPPRRSERTPLDLGRRRVLGTAALGLVAAALPPVSLAGRAADRHGFLRPPGARGERDFLARCARCGQCVAACPTRFVQPALLQAGLEGLWTPVLDARAGYCDDACQRCTGACPTGALERLTLERKREFKLGTAVVDRNRCYTWADGIECTACAERCPVRPRAIRLVPAEVFDARGLRVTVRQAHVEPERCIGCGACEHFCPRGGEPGIVVTAEDEDREGPR